MGLMLMFKILSLLSLCLFASVAPVVAADCSKEAFNFLKEESEIFVVPRHTMMHAFIDCSVSTLGIEVVLHEAVHAEDLGIPSGTKLEDLVAWFEQNPNAEANLFSLDQKHIGAIKLPDAPTPKSLVLKFLNENYASVIADLDHPIHGWLEGYILVDETFASNSFPKGLTELNAYIHGLRLEYRVKKSLSQNDPMNLIYFQRHGLWHFLFLMKAYVHELKKGSPESWNQLNHETNTDILSSLIADAATSLAGTNHCQISDPQEKALFELFADPKFLDEMYEVMKASSSKLDLILCK